MRFFATTLLSLLGAAALMPNAITVNASSTGASSCMEGPNPFPSGPHVNHHAGSLEDGGFTMSLGLRADEPTGLERGIQLDVRVDSPSGTFKGFLFRLSGGDDGADLSGSFATQGDGLDDLGNWTQILESTGEQNMPLAKCAETVSGATHKDSKEKQWAGIYMTINNPVGTKAKLEVTVMVKKEEWYYSSYDITVNPAPKEQYVTPTLLWKASVIGDESESVQDFFYSQPDDLLYVTVNNYVSGYHRAKDASLQILNASDGSVVGSPHYIGREPEDGSSRYPEISQGRSVVHRNVDTKKIELFVMLAWNGNSYRIHAYDTDLGAERWNASMPKLTTRGRPLLMSPDGAKLYAITRNGTITSLNATNGDTLWRERFDTIIDYNDTDDSGTSRATGLALSQDGTRLYGTCQNIKGMPDPCMYVVSAENGTLLQNTSLVGGLTMRVNPLLYHGEDEDSMYVVDDRLGATRLDANDLSREPLWSNPFANSGRNQESTSFSAISSDGQSFYAFAYEEFAKLETAHNGTVQWKKHLGGIPPVRSADVVISPGPDNKHVYYHGDISTRPLKKADALTGEDEWTLYDVSFFQLHPDGSIMYTSTWTKDKKYVSAYQTFLPTPEPSDRPSIEPSSEPTVSFMPSAVPSSQPSDAPTATSMPTKAPTASPTVSPATAAPSKTPTAAPSAKPTAAPSGSFVLLWNYWRDVALLPLLPLLTHFL